MAFKQSGPGALERIDEFDGDGHAGIGWLAHPEETMRRASHALAVDGEVWVVDPVDVPDLDALLAEFGDVAGVVCLLDRHERDSAQVAGRHDVPVYAPPFVDRSFEGVQVERFAGELADTGLHLVQAVDLPGWREGALYAPDETLVVADALGTADYFTVGAERLGVHPMLRPLPPSNLAGLGPERVLVGHGTGVMADGEEALRVALGGARKNLPRAWWNALRETVG
ncbi:hypothetical protein [Halospeciosus flavus]|uniref:Glyoxylase, beta-lactamase superfamily II n=1 Tax=Halospeciosus flavus TaxID=3032283 RepID=A0ABD5Z331_9EURY|nr:hypothetical protein [Halospeciosus flavus]